MRLGGIYALQRLANDSPLDRDTIRNVLSGFVRNHDMYTLQPGQKTPPERCRDVPEDKPPPLSVRPPADVAAALTIAPALTVLNNSGDVTGRADFSHSRFPGTDLIGANLIGANLESANLTGVDLSTTYLARANLTGSDLTGKNLDAADLRGTNLSGADLTGADLGGADLRGIRGMTEQQVQAVAMVDSDTRFGPLPE